MAECWIARRSKTAGSLVGFHFNCQNGRHRMGQFLRAAVNLLQILSPDS